MRKTYDIRFYRTIINEYGETEAEEDFKFPSFYNKLTDNAETFDFLKTQFDIEILADEYSWLIVLGTDLSIKGVFELSHGTIDKTMMPIRSIIEKTLLIRGKKFIVVHNHQSGDYTPSDADLLSWKKIQEAANLMELELVQFLITGKNGFYGTENYEYDLI